jgi:hypothetical protein
MSHMLDSYLPSAINSVLMILNLLKTSQKQKGNEEGEEGIAMVRLQDQSNSYRPILHP